MLKTISGSSPRTDQSRNIAFSQSHSHATVPLIVDESQLKSTGGCSPADATDFLMIDCYQLTGVLIGSLTDVVSGLLTPSSSLRVGPCVRHFK